MTSNSVFSAAAAGRAAAVASGCGHHHRAAGGRLDAVDFFQVVAEFLGLFQGQADDLLAQLLGQWGKLAGCFCR